MIKVFSVIFEEKVYFSGIVFIRFKYTFIYTIPSLGMFISQRFIYIKLLLLSSNQSKNPLLEIFYSPWITKFIKKRTLHYFLRRSLLPHLLFR